MQSIIVEQSLILWIARYETLGMDPEALKITQQIAEPVARSFRNRKTGRRSISLVHAAPRTSSATGARRSPKIISQSCGGRG